MDELYDAAWVAHFGALPVPKTNPSATNSANELIWADQAARLPLHEALSATYSQRGETIHGGAGEFLQDTAEISESEGGYLGPNVDAPLHDGWLPIDIEAVEVHYPNAITAVADLVRRTDLWHSDQWVRGWARERSSSVPRA